MSRITTTLSVGILAILFPVMVFSFCSLSTNPWKRPIFADFPDPVQIQGKAFPALTGGVLENYRVFAAQEGEFKPIRFQIDEMTEEGDFVFPHGRDSNKKLGNGILDPRDVVLFMAKDTGDRVLETSWPGAAARV